MTAISISLFEKVGTLINYDENGIRITKINIFRKFIFRYASSLVMKHMMSRVCIILVRRPLFFPPFCSTDQSREDSRIDRHVFARRNDEERLRKTVGVDGWRRGTRRANDAVSWVDLSPFKNGRFNYGRLASPITAYQRESGRSDTFPRSFAETSRRWPNENKDVSR